MRPYRSLPDAEITLPYKFKPRSYQEPVYKAFFIEKKKRFCCVWHRRAGKDKTFLNLLIMAAMSEIGNYIYLFPETTHAKKVIWNGIDKSGMRFLDHIPKTLLDGRPDNKDLLIKLINGSTIQFMGTNDYDKLRGMNPKGIIISEAQDHHPAVWEILSPILAENGGWVVFEGTPRGTNHFYERYLYSKISDDWFSSFLTIDDTKDENGNPIIKKSIIEEDIKAGIPKEITQQEYYCSFFAAMVGSYYGEHMNKCYEEQRIGDFEIDTTLPVYTAWDIGVNDSTAIWFMQYKDNEMRLINYYENNGQGMRFYFEYLQQFANMNHIRYARHWAPFDINVKEWGSGLTRIELAQSMGFHFDFAPNVSKDDGHNAVRELLPKMRFLEKNCKLGIKCLREYHKEFNRKLKCYENHPAHDWSEHGASAMRYLCLSWKVAYAEPVQNSVVKLRSVAV